MAEPETHRRRSGRRAGMRTASFVAIAVLYAVSIPWYRDGEAPLRLWLGLPDWAAVALLSYTAAAVLNAYAWVLSDIDDADDSSSRLPGERERP